MTSPDRSLPPGYRLLRLSEVGSTNSEALRLAAAGDEGRLWVVAKRQLSGRGRSGRRWVSEPGNLYASLLLRFCFPLSRLAHLPVVAGVASHDAVRAALPLADQDMLRLKWPNDLLYGGAKLAGLLIESLAANDGRETIAAIGVGINLAHHPERAIVHATSLGAIGVTIEPDAMMGHLSRALSHWLGMWNEGEGFALIRRAWLARAIDIGTKISVKLPDAQVFGVFEGLDESGALRLSDRDGVLRRIMHGDVLIDG